MTDWIPATRETDRTMTDEKPLRYSAGPTCTQRQDAELARHDAALEELFSIATLLATDIYTLRKRVIALEKQHETRVDAIPARTATPNQTYSWLPGDAWSRYCAVVDGDDGPDPMEDV